jgi:hypothetical protein
MNGKSMKILLDCLPIGACVALLILWPLGFYLLWKGCGWYGVGGVFVLLFANNIQHHINYHKTKKESL